MSPEDHDLIYDYLHDRLPPERGAALASLLGPSTEARALLRTEAAIEMRLRELATSESLAVLAPEPARTGASRPRSWLAPAAAGIALGAMFATATWASVAAFRREREPVVLPLANGDFESLGAVKVGGYPKEPGVWRGDTAKCVGATTGVEPHAGAGMLQFLKPDAPGRASTNTFTACDQWQLLDLTKVDAVGTGEQWVAEAEVWFNSVASPQATGSTFQITLYAVEVGSLSELNRISSMWLRQSSAVLAAGSRRIVSDADPGTWERLAVTLPLPSRTKYLLLQIAADSTPDSAGKPAFAGQFADSASVQLRKVSRERELLPVN